MVCFLSFQIYFYAFTHILMFTCEYKDFCKYFSESFPCHQIMYLETCHMSTYQFNFFHLLHGILLYEYSTMYLAIFLLMNTEIFPMVYYLQIVLQQTFFAHIFFVNIFSISLRQTPRSKFWITLYSRTYILCIYKIMMM